MQLRILLFVLLCSSLMPYTAFGQKRGMEEEKDTTKLFQGIAVGYNLAGTVMRMVGDYGEFEGMVQVNLKDKYFPLAELGLGSAKHPTDIVTNIQAKTNSPFIRLGCDYNIAKNKHDDYRVLFGVRYGFTNFKQDISGIIEDPVWGGELSYVVDDKSISYHWGEIVFGVDAKLWGPVRLGWTFRYKRRLYANEPEGQNLWYVPGYGMESNALGGTFNVKIELHKKKNDKK